MRSASLLVAVLLLGGCGQPAEEGDVRVEPRETQLRVVVDPGSGGDVRRWTLTCDPAGGDHPDAEAACRALDRLDDPFAPVPADTACTEIYGGPQTARVTGTYRGEPVDATFDRTNGCQIDRWDTHLPVLVEPGGAEDL